MEITNELASELAQAYKERECDLKEQNVLVVEDDPFWQNVIRRNIEKVAQGCNVTMATSAEEAIALMDFDDRFQLVVADHYLDGEKTGYELWFECKRRGIQVPFLLTSGVVDFPSETLNKLPVRFVPKPFVAAELRRTLKDLLDGPPEKTVQAQAFYLWTFGLFTAVVLIVIAIFLPSKLSANKVVPIQPLPDQVSEVLGRIATLTRMRDPPLVYRFEKDRVFTAQLLRQIKRITNRADEIIALAESERINHGDIQ